jgi:hypothetical protein
MFVGLRKLTIFYDSLRYSLVPSEKMLLSSINRSEDAERKCSEEDGINAMVNDSHQEQDAC